MTTLNNPEILLPICPHFVFTYEPTVVTHMGVRLITSILAVTIAVIHVGLWNSHIAGVALEEKIAIHQLCHENDS